MKNSKPHHNVVVLGDFNVKPNSVSGVFMNGQYPEYDRLEIKHEIRSEIVIKECQKLFERFNFQLFSKFGFLNCYSVYKQFKEGLGQGAIERWEDGFPEMTNFTEDFKALIDHIVISTNGMKLVALKELPTVKQAEEFGYIGFPCDEFPSDHIPLCAELVLKSHVPLIYPV